MSVVASVSIALTSPSSVAIAASCRLERSINRSSGDLDDELKDSPSLVGGVVVTEVCHEGESTRHPRARRSRTERVSFLLIFLSGGALYLPGLPLVASCGLCLVSIAASLVGIWSVFAYRKPFRAIHGASVPSDFDPSVGVHGANSTEHAADKHVC